MQNSRSFLEVCGKFAYDSTWKCILVSVRCCIRRPRFECVLFAHQLVRRKSQNKYLNFEIYACSVSIDLQHIYFDWFSEYGASWFITFHYVYDVYSSIILLMLLYMLSVRYSVRFTCFQHIGKC